METVVELLASVTVSAWILTSVAGVGGWIWLTVRSAMPRSARLHTERIRRP